MNNLFVTDATKHASIDGVDLGALLANHRVSKVTVGADGAITIDLHDVVATSASDIIRKAEGLHKGNKTGFRGVSIRGKKYRADISEDGVQYNLGSFNTIQEAIEARILAEKGLD